MDFELLNVQADSPLIRNLTSDENEYNLDVIDTPYGTITVAKQGADHKQKPVILTYHDIGLNHVSNFQPFFNYADMRLLQASFARKFISLSFLNNYLSFVLLKGLKCLLMRILSIDFAIASRITLICK